MADPGCTAGHAGFKTLPLLQWRMRPVRGRGTRPDSHQVSKTTPSGTESNLGGRPLPVEAVPARQRDGLDRSGHDAVMSVKFRITSVTSNSGETVSLPSSGVICVVGGNNVGKSQLLRDLSGITTESFYTPVVLQEAAFSRGGSSDDFGTWLAQNATPSEPGPGGQIEYRPLTGRRADNLERLLDSWGQDSAIEYNVWARFLLWFGTAGNLSSVASGSGRGGSETYSEAESPLVGRLLRSGPAEDELASLTGKLFGEPIVLDRLSDQLQLRVGHVRVPIPPLNRPTPDYEKAVAQLPLLTHQGDGVKSFTGMALAVIASPQQVMLVDEPEAFLHPAQARALGRWLSHEALLRDKQILLATHDKDLLLGLLNADQPITILRVTRSGVTNFLRALDFRAIESVWADPVLRYSNVLEGLFYDQVVICESDADCRFYSAVMDAAAERGKRMLADGTLFVPAGGKQRLAVLARSLSSLGVRVASLPDFDILNTKSELKALVEASGGAWNDDLNRDYTTVTSWVNDQVDGWAHAKVQGLTFLRAGAIYAAGAALLAELREQGVHVVPYGEMESLQRSIGMHGSRWVSEMLSRDGHKTSTQAGALILPLLQAQADSGDVAEGGRNSGAQAESHNNMETDGGETLDLQHAERSLQELTTPAADQLVPEAPVSRWTRLKQVLVGE